MKKVRRKDRLVLDGLRFNIEDMLEVLSKTTDKDERRSLECQIKNTEEELLDYYKQLPDIEE